MTHNICDQNDSYPKNDGKRDVTDTNRETLTDAEREAIEESMRQNSESDCISTEKAQEINATLRNLLARLK